MPIEPFDFDRPPLNLIALHWEKLAWAALLILLVFTRFYDLGTRAMSHDEAQHAVYSFNLYESGDYRHQPFLHGPFLFHLNAFLFFLFGVSDATARFGPALAAVAGAAVIFLFRGYLGRRGALSAALLILVSPTLLFYGRYLRNDIYIALFALIWIYCVFRYLDSPRPGPLYGLVGAMGLAFATKENSFIFGATLGSFLVIVGIKRILGDGRMGSKRSEADLAVLMLTLALPFRSLRLSGSRLGRRQLSGRRQSLQER